jgi:cell division protein FtsZ
MKKAKKTKKNNNNESSGPSRKAHKPSVALPVIKVIGVGGGGGNAVSRMLKSIGSLRGVEFIAINTDHQDLDYCPVKHKIYIGKNLTRGLGTGMNPELGRQAVEENKAEITESLRGSDLVFLAAGLGGGTGSGGLPVVADIARQLGALTFAFVTKPFSFEGTKRMQIAEEALIKLKDKVDILVVISNDKISSFINKDTSILKAFLAIDDVLKNAILGIVEIIALPGIINLDFADIKSVVEDAGPAVVGVGIASGQNRAALAAEAALNSPLLEVSANGAKGIIFGVAGGKDLKMTEIYEAAQKIAEIADPGAKIIFGTYYDKNLKPGQLKITLIATGLNGGAKTVSLFSENKASTPFLDFKTLGVESVSENKPKINPILSLNKEDKEEKEDKSKFNLTSKFNLIKKNSEEQKELLKSQNKITEDSLKTENKDEDIWDTPAFLRKKKK